MGSEGLGTGYCLPAIGETMLIDPISAHVIAFSRDKGKVLLIR